MMTSYTTQEFELFDAFSFLSLKLKFGQKVLIVSQYNSFQLSRTMAAS